MGDEAGDVWPPAIDPGTVPVNRRPREVRLRYGDFALCWAWVWALTVLLADLPKVAETHIWGPQLLGDEAAMAVLELIFGLFWSAIATATLRVVLGLTTSWVVDLQGVRKIVRLTAVLLALLIGLPLAATDSGFLIHDAAAGAWGPGLSTGSIYCEAAGIALAFPLATLVAGAVLVRRSGGISG